jgi:hypothetical protein
MQDSKVEAGKREVQSKREDATATVAGAGSKQKQSTGATEPIALPQSQARFLLAVEAGRGAYTAGGNDLAKGAARPARADAICAALGGPQMVGGSRDFQYSVNLNATDWYGSVATLSSNNDGKGVLSIEIGKNVYVKTWNNVVSDAGSGTLIEPGSVIHSVAAGLRARQRVKFSGVFFRGPQDCIRESSLTIDGSLREPEFIMHFTRLSAAP